MEESGVSRAGQAVKLLTRIRQERPELWQQIKEFARRCSDASTAEEDRREGETIPSQH